MKRLIIVDGVEAVCRDYLAKDRVSDKREKHDNKTFCSRTELKSHGAYRKTLCI